MCWWSYSGEKLSLGFVLRWTVSVMLLEYFLIVLFMCYCLNYEREECSRYVSVIASPSPGSVLVTGAAGRGASGAVTCRPRDLAEVGGAGQGRAEVVELVTGAAGCGRSDAAI